MRNHTFGAFTAGFLIISVALDLGFPMRRFSISDNVRSFLALVAVALVAWAAYTDLVHDDVVVVASTPKRTSVKRKNVQQPMTTDELKARAYGSYNVPVPNQKRVNGTRPTETSTPKTPAKKPHRPQSPTSRVARPAADSRSPPHVTSPEPRPRGARPYGFVVLSTSTQSGKGVAKTFEQARAKCGRLLSKSLDTGTLPDNVADAIGSQLMSNADALFGECEAIVVGGDSVYRVVSQLAKLDAEIENY